VNKNLFIHIGLGKTSTTTLQKKIFPELSKDINYEFIDKNSLFNLIKKSSNLTNNINNIVDFRSNYLNNNLKINKINLNNAIVSFEGLAGYLYNINLYEKMMYFTRELFGSESKIIITIREPLDYLNSEYIMAHRMTGITENEFILNNCEYTFPLLTNGVSKNPWTKDNISYLNLINLYKKNFNDVFILKYENIKQFLFIKEIFNLDNLEKYKHIYSVNRLNVSYGKYHINFLNILRLILNENWSIKVFNKFKNFIPFKKNHIKIDNFPEIKNIIDQASLEYQNII